MKSNGFEISLRSDSSDFAIVVWVMEEEATS